MIFPIFEGLKKSAPVLIGGFTVSSVMQKMFSGLIADFAEFVRPRKFYASEKSFVVSSVDIDSIGIRHYHEFYLDFTEFRKYLILPRK